MARLEPRPVQVSRGPAPEDDWAGDYRLRSFRPRCTMLLKSKSDRPRRCFSAPFGSRVCTARSTTHTDCYNSEFNAGKPSNRARLIARQ